jgi:hypothetical protein
MLRADHRKQKLSCLGKVFSEINNVTFKFFFIQMNCAYANHRLFSNRRIAHT